MALRPLPASPVLRSRPLAVPPRGAINATSRSVSPTVAAMLDNEARLNAAGPAFPTAAAPPKKHKAKSILGQFGDIGKGLLPGAVGFLKDALTDAVVAPRAIADVVGGHGLRNIDQYLPAAMGLIHSVGSTGSDIIHPERFAEAVRNGTIVSKVLGDVGNVAMVAAPVASALGAGGAVASNALAGSLPEALPAYRGLAGVAERAGASGLAQGLQTTGNVVRAVGTLGEMPGNALAKPFELAGKGLVRGGTALGLDRVVSPALSRVGQGVTNALSADLSNIPGLKTLGKMNRAWKTWTLPFNAKWQAGNAIGAPLQAYFHGGVGPFELTRRAFQTVRSEGGGSLIQGARKMWALNGSPAWADELASHRMSALGPTPTGRTAVGRAVGKAAGLSYKVNEFADNLSRDANYLAKRAAGESHGQAVQSTLRTFGDYGGMSRVEQDVLRQVAPFYPWLKHQVGATLRMPFTKPGRAALLAGTTSRYYDPDNPPSPLIGQKLPFGADKLLNIGSGVPFADISPFGFALDPANIGQSLSPVLRGGSAILGGFDLGTMKPISRPSGQSRLDEFGRPTLTPPIFRLLTDPRHALGEIGYQLAQQGPTPVREGRNALLGNARRYSGTGYQYGRKPDPNRSRVLSLLRGLGVPTIEPTPTKGGR